MYWHPKSFPRAEFVDTKVAEHRTDGFRIFSRKRPQQTPVHLIRSDLIRSIVYVARPPIHLTWSNLSCMWYKRRYILSDLIRFIVYVTPMLIHLIWYNLSCMRHNAGVFDPIWSDPSCMRDERRYIWPDLSCRVCDADAGLFDLIWCVLHVALTPVYFIWSDPARSDIFLVTCQKCQLYLCEKTLKA